MGRRKIHREEIAFAMELRAWGASWKSIGRGLGLHPDSIRKAVQLAEIKGYKAFPAYSETVFHKRRTRAYYSRIENRQRAEANETHAPTLFAAPAPRREHS